METHGIKVANARFHVQRTVVGSNIEQSWSFYVPVDLGDQRAKHLLELVQETRGKAGLLVMSGHWGPNWRYEPPSLLQSTSPSRTPSATTGPTSSLVIRVTSSGESKSIGAGP